MGFSPVVGFLNLLVAQLLRKEQGFCSNFKLWQSLSPEHLKTQFKKRWPAQTLDWHPKLSILDD
jgi:hypothetical protein